MNHPIKLARIGMRTLVSEDKPGVILPIASVGGIAGTYHCPLYIATKHGIVGFVKSMELAERYEGVKIVTICPGAVDSPLWSDEKRQQVNFETFESMKPDDVAKAMIDVSLQMTFVLRRRMTTLTMCLASARWQIRWWYMPGDHAEQRP